MLADGSLVERAPVLMTRGGVVTDTLATIPFGNLVWNISVPGTGGGSYRTQPVSDSPIHAFALDERALILVDRDAPRSMEDASFRVTKLNFDGDTLFSRTFDFEPLPVGENEFDSLLNAFAAGAARIPAFNVSETEARRLAAATLYRPAFRPGVRFVVPARDGTIWIKLEPGDAENGTWLVLASDGEPMGRVSLPTNVLVRQVDLPLVWGVETDEYDVPYVVRYRVTRPMISLRDAPGATLRALPAVTRRVPGPLTAAREVES
jgi:hypothetical protein